MENLIGIQAAWVLKIAEFLLGITSMAYIVKHIKD